MTWTKTGEAQFLHSGATDDFMVALENVNVPAEPSRMSAGVAYSITSLRANDQARVTIRSDLAGRQNIQAGIVDHVFLATLGVSVAAGLYGVALRKNSAVLPAFSIASAYTLLARSTSDLVTTGAITSNTDREVRIEARTASGRLSLFINDVTSLTAAATGDYLLTDSDYPSFPGFGFNSHINGAVVKRPTRAALISQRPTTTQLCSIVSGGEMYASTNGQRPRRKGIVSAPENDVDADFLDARIFYVDGENFYYYDFVTDLVKKMGPDNGNDYWVITDADPDNVTGAPVGALPDPADTTNRRRTGSTTATVVTAQGKRIYLGSELELQASAVADPFDYNVGSLIDGRSFVYDSENLSSVIRSPIVCLEPYEEDYMLIGCMGEIHVLRGDPVFDDAVITNITRSVGVCGKDAAEVGESGSMWVLTEQGLDKVQAGMYIPVSSTQLSTGIEKGANWILTKPKIVRDTAGRGVLVYYTSIMHETAEENFWWDEQSDGPFPEFYPDDTEITAVGRVNGEVLVGTSGGFVYVYDKEQTSDDMADDDGGDTPITTLCPVGLIMDTDGTELTMTTHCAIGLTRGSGTVTLEFFAGRTPEDAYTVDDPVTTFSIGQGRSELPVRVAGGAIVPVISTDGMTVTTWSIDYLDIKTIGGGLIPDLDEPTVAVATPPDDGFGDDDTPTPGTGDGPIDGSGGGGDITGVPWPVLALNFDEIPGLEVFDQSPDPYMPPIWTGPNPTPGNPEQPGGEANPPSNDPGTDPFNPPTNVPWGGGGTGGGDVDPF